MNKPHHPRRWTSRSAREIRWYVEEMLLNIWLSRVTEILLWVYRINLKILLFKKIGTLEVLSFFFFFALLFIKTIPFFFLHPRTWLLILERKERREREGEKHWCEREISVGCLLLPHNLAMCPERELNLLVQGMTLQQTEPHQSRLYLEDLWCTKKVFVLWESKQNTGRWLAASISCNHRREVYRFSADMQKARSAFPGRHGDKGGFTYVAEGALCTKQVAKISVILGHQQDFPGKGSHQRAFL